MSREYKNVISQIFKYLAISLVFMVFGFFVGQRFIPQEYIYYANRIIAILGVLFVLLAIFSRKRILPSRFSMNYVYLFTFIDGILMYPLFQYYLYDLGIGLFVSIVLGTAVLFGVLSMVSSRKSGGYYLGLGNILFAGLVGLLVLGLINIFFGGARFNLVISAISLLIFTGYILYDISLIKYSVENRFIKDKNDLSIHVLNLYLDFINILLNLLNIASYLDD